MEKINWDALTRGLAADEPASTQQLWAYARDLIHAFLRQEHPRMQEADLDDVTQEAAEKLVRFCLQPRRRIASITEDKFQGLLEGFAQNAFWESSKGTARHPRAMVRQKRDQARALSEAPDESLQRQEMLETLRDLVHRLPKPQAEVVQLYCAGRTHKEIAERLDVTSSTVKRWLQLARQRLRQLLPPEDEVILSAERSLFPAPQAVPLTPELRKWALQQFTEEESIAGLRGLRQKGGLELKDFLQELEPIVEHGSEPTQR